MRRSFLRHVGLNGVYNGDSEFMAGESIMFSGPADKIPAGYLIEDGAEVGRVAYATLFAAIGTTYGAGDGATTFNLPDSRGEFWRGLDLGCGVDLGRGVGSKQGDSIRKIVGEVGQVCAWVGTEQSGALRVVDSGGGSLGAGGGIARVHKLTLDTSILGGEFNGNETRGRNLAKIPLIKY